MIFGYSRISTDKQDTQLQHDALALAPVDRIFTDRASGADFARPELHRMLDQLRPGDEVVVWKMDRLARSVKDTIVIVERIQASGAHFRSLTESIETKTPAGRMFFTIVAAFAELERGMIRERTMAGLAAARSQGRRGGRRRALTAAQEADVRENVRSQRRTQAEMARLYNVSKTTISRACAGIDDLHPRAVNDAPRVTDAA